MPQMVFKGSQDIYQTTYVIQHQSDDEQMDISLLLISIISSICILGHWDLHAVEMNTSCEELKRGPKISLFLFFLARFEPVCMVPRQWYMSLNRNLTGMSRNRW